MNYIQELNAFRDWCYATRPSAGEIALWYAIMQVSNQMNWPEEFTVSNDTLQSLSGLERSVLHRARNRLIQKGRITYQKRSGTLAGMYAVVPFDGKDFDVACNTTCNTTRNTSATLRATQAQHKRNTAFIQNSINLNLNKTKTPPYSPPAGELFDHFWKAYPRHVGKDPARKAFAKLKPDEALWETMLTALNRQKQSDQWQRDGGQYIPYPATWLNQRRWEDETPEEPQQEQPYRYPTPEDDAPYRRSITGHETLADLISGEEVFRGGDDS